MSLLQATAGIDMGPAAYGSPWGDRTRVLAFGSSGVSLVIWQLISKGRKNKGCGSSKQNASCAANSLAVFYPRKHAFVLRGPSRLGSIPAPMGITSMSSSVGKLQAIAKVVPPSLKPGKFRPPALPSFPPPVTSHAACGLPGLPRTSAKPILSKRKMMRSWANHRTEARKGKEADPQHAEISGGSVLRRRSQKRRRIVYDIYKKCENRI